MRNDDDESEKFILEVGSWKLETGKKTGHLFAICYLLFGAAVLKLNIKMRGIKKKSSIVAKDLVSDDSDDKDVEYMGHFCSECSIPPPGGVRGWVRGYGVWCVVLGCGKQVLGVRAAKTTIMRV
jgi:hypothetical protein